MTDFLSIDDFTGRFPRPMTDAETLVATDLLTVASNWIYGRLPTISSADPAAKTVTFEVVRDAILYGLYARFDSFQNLSLHRTEAGAFSEDVIDQFVTERHARMLGISLTAAPVFNFPAPESFPGCLGRGF